MPTTYTDQFYLIDPSAPPAAGTVLTVYRFDLVDQNNNNLIGNAANDSIDGSDISRTYPGDTVTVTVNGVTRTITGTTFYLADGRRIFTPTDGSNLYEGTFVSSTFVSTQGNLPVGNLGPTCFAIGTRISTIEGEVPIEELRLGDRVLTLDNGYEPVRWIGRHVTDATGSFAPVQFASGVLGNHQALLVSPQHRVLMQGARTELLFGETEVLIAAIHMVGRAGVTRVYQPEVTYMHLLFDRHEIIFGNGAPSESFHPGGLILTCDRALRAEIAAIFPDCPGLKAGCRVGAARPMLSGREALLLAA